MANKINVDAIVKAALEAAQMAAEEKFRAMAGHPQYSIQNTNPMTGEKSGKKFTMLGLIGFVWIHFKGVKSKNMLVKAGLSSGKSYYGGFDLRLPNLKSPDWANTLDDHAAGYFYQSMDIKQAAMAAFLAVMNKNGLMEDAYVDSRLD